MRSCKPLRRMFFKGRYTTLDSYWSSQIRDRGKPDSFSFYFPLSSKTFEFAFSAAQDRVTAFWKASTKQYPGMITKVDYFICLLVLAILAC